MLSDRKRKKERKQCTLKQSATSAFFHSSIDLPVEKSGWEEEDDDDDDESSMGKL